MQRRRRGHGLALLRLFGPAPQQRGDDHQHLEGHEVRSFGRSHLAHTIDVDPGSELGRAAGDHKIRVNSLHHQVIGKLAPGLVQTARDEDGNDLCEVHVNTMEGFCSLLRRGAVTGSGTGPNRTKPQSVR